MPKGPKGEKRPADVVRNAVHVMRVATGEIEEEYETDALPDGSVRLHRCGFVPFSQSQP